MTITEMRLAIAALNITAAPLTPTGCAVPTGYILRGPRGSKKVVIVQADGTVDGFSIQLWLDCLGYANAKVLDRRMARLARKTARNQHPAIKRVTWTPAASV